MSIMVVAASTIMDVSLHFEALWSQSQALKTLRDGCVMSVGTRSMSMQS